MDKWFSLLLLIIVSGALSSITTTRTSIVKESTTKYQGVIIEVPLRGSCNSRSRCMGDNVECHRGHCRCQEGYAPTHDARDTCSELPIYNLAVQRIDPIVSFICGGIVGLVLIITTFFAVRLFYRARAHGNGTKTYPGYLAHRGSVYSLKINSSTKI